MGSCCVLSFFFFACFDLGQKTTWLLFVYPRVSLSLICSVETAAALGSATNNTAN